MVTATVQCKRHQREGSDGKGDVLNTPHPPRRAGLEPRSPRSARSTQRECHKVPVLGCTPGLSQCCPSPARASPPLPGAFVPRDALGGHLRDNEGRWEWAGNAALAWIPQILPLATQSRDRGSWSSAPGWEGRRRRKRRVPRPGWHRGPVQSWHWLAEGP